MPLQAVSKTRFIAFWILICVVALGSYLFIIMAQSPELHRLSRTMQKETVHATLLEKSASKACTRYIMESVPFDGFSSFMEGADVQQEGDTWKVQRVIVARSTFTFTTRIRGIFECTMRHNDKDQWQLLRLRRVK